METQKSRSSPVREGGAYARLAALFDEGTFSELSAYVGGPEYASVICGYGAVEGALTFAFAQDPGRDAGGVGSAEADKIASLYALAGKSGAPVVGIFASSGARIAQGNAAMAAFGRILSCVSRLSGIVPQIAVIDGVCAGMSAVAASMFDVIVANEQGHFYMNPPSVLKSKGDKAAGSVRSAAANGLCDIVCPDGVSAIAKVRELLSVLPQNDNQGLAYSQSGDDLSRLTPEIGGMSDPMAVITALTDCGNFLPFKADCAPEVITGLAPMGGTTTGVAALLAGGILTPKAARKIAGFLSFCDSFRIPFLTLVDTGGIDLSVDAENAPYASELSRLASAYASSTNAKVTVVLGKAYGAACTLLGSKAVGADLVYAVQSAEISVMEPAAAVQFLYGDEIHTPAERQARIAEWIADKASPAAAAAAGEVDDVIAPADVRAKVISAFMMLWAKAEGSVARKHSKLPF